MLVIPVLGLQRFLPWCWLVVMILCFVVEACTMTLTTVWFALAALVMVFVAMLPVPLPVQLLLFALLSVVLLLVTRPFALRFLKLRKTATNSDALVGQRCRLVTAVTADGKGTVRLNGVEWSASCRDGSSLAAGTDCVITEIQGNTLIVTGV